MEVKSLMVGDKCMSRLVYLDGPVGKSQVGFISQCSRKEDVVDLRKLFINYMLSTNDVEGAKAQLRKLILIRDRNSESPTLKVRCDEVLKLSKEYFMDLNDTEFVKELV